MRHKQPLWKIRLNFAGQVYEWYRHAPTKPSAKLIGIRILEKRLHLIPGALINTFNGNRDNFSVTGVLVTARGQIKELLYE